MFKNIALPPDERMTVGTFASQNLRCIVIFLSAWVRNTFSLGCTSIYRVMILVSWSCW
uniref:Uncharacterized protein n=1 Tax=Arundo donax TaxID=35708 RepID=A0A0A8XZV2_ARUDO